MNRAPLRMRYSKDHLVWARTLLACNSLEKRSTPQVHRNYASIEAYPVRRILQHKKFQDLYYKKHFFAYRTVLE